MLVATLDVLIHDELRAAAADRLDVADTIASFERSALA
ncbi:hypothetical protein FraQA3DRAFT_1245 [Frankia sp. QA3]|nr:hypothetical protein FraQA3DRAFT_1245 [Frankia sp. QA3]